MNSSTDTTPIARTARVRIVWPNVCASGSFSRRRPMNSGTNGAATPLATTMPSDSSGMTNAALNASSSSPAPNVRIRIRSRTRPMT